MPRASDATARRARVPSFPHEVNWVVKASKLCNLRCRYCYEWDDLAKRDRMSLAQWELLLQAVRGYHRTVERSVGPDRGVRSNIIWHGGEPLLLPTRYFEDVFALEREVLSDVDHRNVLQSNLYVMPSRTMDVLEQEHVQLGVSFDLVPGVRLARDGSTTEEAVAANIERLQARGVQLGAVVVLAGHTAPHVRRIYDFFAGRDLPVRFLPMFDAPLNTPEAPFALSEAATVRTLQQLFRHWMRATPRAPTWPLVDYVYTALLASKGETREAFDRADPGEWALLVDTDGTLYHRPDAYVGDRALGNVFDQPIGEILGSERYASSLQRDRALVSRQCHRCRFRGACDTCPLFESPRQLTGPRCSISHAMFGYVTSYFAKRGIGPDGISQVLVEL